MNNLQILIEHAIYHHGKPISGYDLTKKIRPKTGHSHQQIYREVGKMESDGHLVSKLIPQEGKPDKRVYSIPASTKVLLGVEIIKDYSKTPSCIRLACMDMSDGGDRAEKFQTAMSYIESGVYAAIIEGESK